MPNFPPPGKKHPSPNTYDISKAERQLFGTQPSYTMVRKDYLWEPWVKNSKTLTLSFVCDLVNSRSRGFEL